MNVLRRKPNPSKVSFKDIKALKEAAIQEDDYGLFETCSKALYIGFRNNIFYRQCEYEIRRRRL